MPTNQSIFLLPRDLLIQILLFLPFDSIPACKLVSKEWKNLTEDPRFLNHYKSLAFFYIKNTVYCVSTKEGNKKIRRTVNGCCNPPLAVNRVPIDLKDGDCIRELLSESSRGRACVVTKGGRLFFYNSFTGDSNAPTDTYYDFPWICFGFGYDRYADDCKTMMAFDSCKDEDRSLFRVYSLRNRAWKSFKGFPFAAYFWNHGHRACSFNGVLHWAIRRRGMVENKVILTYDLHTCRFGEMLLPDAAYEPVVAEFGGRLCCWTYVFTLRAWTMREYGVSESWTRFVSIDLTRLSRSPFRWNMIEPMMLYKCQDGRKVMLFVCKRYGTLYWYDIDNDKVTRIQKNTWEKRRNRKRKAPEINQS